MKPITSWGARRGRTALVALLVAALTAVIAYVAAARAPAIPGEAAPTPEMASVPPHSTLGIPESFEIFVDSQPRPGWLYILDSNDLLYESARVVLLDPESGKVEAQYSAGYDPAAVLSPDGSVMYVASTVNSKSVVRALDTSSGRVLLEFGVLHRLGSIAPPKASYLAVSGDGTELYVLRMRTVTPGTDEFSVGVFDTGSGDLLRSLRLPDGCGVGFFVSDPDGNKPQAVCPGAVAVLEIAPGASQAPRALERSPVGVAQTRGRLLAISSSGILSVYETGDVTPGREVNLQVGRPVRENGLIASGDGAMLFVATGENVASIEDVLVLDAQTLVPTGSIHFSRPVWSITPSHDGARLYGIERATGSVSVIDVVAGGEAKRIEGVANDPAMALVAP